MDWQAGSPVNEGLSTLYDIFAGHLGEALGSSGPSEPATRAEWEAALLTEGIFFRYDVELTGAIFARWFGTEAGGASGPMQQFYLSARPDAVYLYYMGRDGSPYRSVTAVRSEDILEILASLTPNGARFGFLEPAYVGTDPDAVLLPLHSGIPVIAGYNAVGRVYAQQDTFLEALGMTPALVRSMDEGGIRTIVEGGTTLHIQENGLLLYQCQSQHPRLSVDTLGAPDLSQAIETARQIVQVLRLLSDEAEIWLTHWHYADDQFVLEFGYYLAGVPIWTMVPAAQVVITGRHVTEVTLLARAFYQTGLTAPVMPEIQAAAAANEVPLRLTYALIEGNAIPLDGTSVELVARWLLVSGSEDRDG